MHQFRRSEGGPSGLLFFCIIFWRFPLWGTGGGILSLYYIQYILSFICSIFRAIGHDETPS